MEDVHKSAGVVRLFAAGTFGQAVASHLTVLRQDVVVSIVSDQKSLPAPEVSQPRVILLAAWRIMPTFCRLLDDLSHEIQVPWVPLILHSTLLRIGPVVVPGQGCCWVCSLQRVRQHSLWPAAELGLWQHYDDHFDEGPTGYLEPFAMIGAARLANIVDALGAADSLAGHLWEIDLLTRKFRNAKAVGVDNCPRCGLHRSLIDRGFIEIKNQLAHLWGKQGQE